MRMLVKNAFEVSGLVSLHGKDWLEKQREAGKIASLVLSTLKNLVNERSNHSLLEFDALAEDIITKAGAKPTFKGYQGFPNTLCTSVNNQLVHGIPSDYRLKEGDLVSFDVGVTVDGAIADTAITCIYGEPKQGWHSKLVFATEEALEKGIKAISVGKKLGVIGEAIYKSAKGHSFNVITNYSGHTIGCDKNGNGILHSAPSILNKDNSNNGIRIQPGLVLCLEPMLGIGDTSTTVGCDGWTVYTKSIFAHQEHTVFVHQNYVEVITRRQNEQKKVQL